jgi:hypothetical protein
VTTEINGSNIYCSEDGDENNAPVIAIDVKCKGMIKSRVHTRLTVMSLLLCSYIAINFVSQSSIDDALRNMDHSLNVSLVNHFLRNSVIVTLQWPREAGAVYHVSVSPETPHTELTGSDHIFVINLTISYNTQHNVSFVSSLCGVTTTKVLNYGKHEKLTHPY